MGENVEVDSFSMSDYLAASLNITLSYTLMDICLQSTHRYVGAESHIRTYTHTHAHWVIHPKQKDSESFNTLLTGYRLKTVFVATRYYWLLLTVASQPSSSRVRFYCRTIIIGSFLKSLHIAGLVRNVQPKPGRMTCATQSLISHNQRVSALITLCWVASLTSQHIFSAAPDLVA